MYSFAKFLFPLSLDFGCVGSASATMYSFVKGNGVEVMVTCGRRKGSLYASGGLEAIKDRKTKSVRSR